MLSNWASRGIDASSSKYSDKCVSNIHRVVRLLLIAKMLTFHSYDKSGVFFFLIFNFSTKRQTFCRLSSLKFHILI